MAGKYAQFYFTKQDPDYSIKGSRDPLAFQVLWQHQARKLIPYLSTVSSNLHDFQILCLAYYFYEGRPDIAFVKFFLRFEQLMGYVRFNPSSGTSGFNGVDSIRRKLQDNNRVSVSNTTADEILSNQRAYGIWGKYNRPFQDIGFTKRSDFNAVFKEKIDTLSDVDSVMKIINKVITHQQSRFDVSELECLKSLLYYTKKERSFYSESILKVGVANPYQNELLQFVSNAYLPYKLDLYAFLKSFSKSLGKQNDTLKSILEEIEFTEKILCPLNYIFRYLQGKPIWEKNELLKDAYISKCKTQIDYIFHGGSEECNIKNQLAQTLTKGNWNLVVDLANRNKEVTEWREGAPWITINKDIIEVHHAEGGFQDPGFDPKKYFDNGYFIDTYISLYRQTNSKG